MNPTVGPSIMLPLHLLLVLLQLLVGQLVEGVRRLWLWWELRLADGRLAPEQRRKVITVN